MKLSSSQIKTTRHQFDAFCKKLLKNEARDYNKGLQCRCAYQILFSEMTKKELNELMTMDKYEIDVCKFPAYGLVFEIENDLLAEALSQLPEQNRNILLLSYFLDMSDVEIAMVLGMARSTVQYRRIASLDKLRRCMGGES